MSKRPCSRRPAACGSLPSYPPRRAAGSAGWTTTKRPITLYPGQRVHMTARDVVSRKEVVAAYKTGNSSAAEHFLRHELPRMGFPIRARPIDGGSEFKANFERACQALGIQLFVLPPRSPRLNGHVERAHRTLFRKSSTTWWMARRLGLAQHPAARARGGVQWPPAAPGLGVPHPERGPGPPPG